MNHSLACTGVFLKKFGLSMGDLPTEMSLSPPGILMAETAVIGEEELVKEFKTRVTWSDLCFWGIAQVRLEESVLEVKDLLGDYSKGAGKR